MCLVLKYTDEQKEEMTVEKAYKVVAVDAETNDYLPPFSVIDVSARLYIEKKPFEEGLNEANTGLRILYKGVPGKGPIATYQAGFHLFVSKEEAKNLEGYLNEHYQGDNKRYEYKTITCTLEKEWITAMGEEWTLKNGKYDILGETKAIVVIASKVNFPKK